MPFPSFSPCPSPPHLTSCPPFPVPRSSARRSQPPSGKPPRRGAAESYAPPRPAAAGWGWGWGWGAGRRGGKVVGPWSGSTGQGWAQMAWSCSKTASSMVAPFVGELPQLSQAREASQAGTPASGSSAGGQRRQQRYQHGCRAPVPAGSAPGQGQDSRQWTAAGPSLQAGRQESSAAHCEGGCRGVLVGTRTARRWRCAGHALQGPRQAGTSSATRVAGGPGWQRAALWAPNPPSPAGGGLGSPDTANIVILRPGFVRFHCMGFGQPASCERWCQAPVQGRKCSLAPAQAAAGETCGKNCRDA